MNKLFRPKCLRRVLLCLAMLFPIVYLCGGLFFALGGSHGEFPFAYEENTPVLNQQNAIYGRWADNINGDVFSRDQSSLTDLFSVNSSLQYKFNWNNINIQSCYVYTYSNSSFLERYLISSNVLIYFNSNVSNIRCGFYPVDSSILIDITHFEITYDESPQGSSDYIFSQPFANNNFITTLGKDLVNGSTKGFNPMNELFRTINTNIMHFEDTDGLAMFGLGYVYYAVNVLIIYEILILAVKLIMLPLRSVELFDKREDM